jgi:hypothetical protein
MWHYGTTVQQSNMLFLCALLPSELQGTLREGRLHSYSVEANSKTTNGLVNKDTVPTNSACALFCQTLVVSTPGCFLLYWLFRLVIKKF